MRLPTGVLVWSSAPHKGCSEEEKGNNTDSVQRAEESKFRGTGSMLSGEIGRQLNSQKVGCLRRTPELPTWGDPRKAKCSCWALILALQKQPEDLYSPPRKSSVCQRSRLLLLTSPQFSLTPVRCARPCTQLADGIFPLSVQ